MPQPNMQQMLKQMQKVQADMARAQEEIAAAEVQASSGGGMVTVTMSGSLEVKSVRIEPGAIDPDDPELLADLVMAAVNEALRSAQQLAAQKMERVTGGLDLSSLGGLGLPGF
jgi:DNA-binding YbaB/EbfC family protein